MRFELYETVRYSQTDGKLRLTVPALLDYFQDVATLQAEEAGVSAAALAKRNLAWFLISWNVEITRLPVHAEKVIAGTFPYYFHSRLGSRNCYLKTPDGEWLAKADCLWAMMDREKGRMIPIPDDVAQAYETEEKLPMEYFGRRIDLPEGMTAGEPIAVRAENIDYHGHVNNSQYIHIIRPLLPETISRIRIEYKRQTRLGEWLTPMTKEENGVTYIALCADGEPHVNIEITH